MSIITRTSQVFLTVALFFVTLGVAPSVAQADNRWMPVEGPDGKVSVQLPAGYEQIERSSVTPVGKVVTRVKKYEADGRILGFGYTKLPKVVTMMGGEKRAYDVAKFLLLGEFDAKQTGYRLTKMGGKTAGELLYTCDHDGTPHTGKAVFILIGQMLYSVNALEPTGQPNALGEKLFASVQVR